MSFNIKTKHKEDAECEPEDSCLEIHHKEVIISWASNS